MAKNESSLTALIAAFARAYHSKYDSPKIFDDFIAKDLFSQKECEDIRKSLINGIQFFNREIGEIFQNHPEEILKWVVQVQLCPTPLARAAYCENVLFHEIVIGAKQYVILGAGLDTFCLRHPEIQTELEIFEVDYLPAQEFKKNRLVNADYPIPDNLHFVPMDFTKDISLQKLIDKGFQSSKKTIYSLLGVSYYLTKEEVFHLLDKLFASIPLGSSIVFDYADDRLFEEKGISNRVQNMVQMASASGEPMKSCFTFNEIEKLLEDAGLLIYEHLSPDDISSQFFGGRTDDLKAFETIHYIHAVKR